MTYSVPKSLKISLAISIALVIGSAATVGAYYAYLMTQIGHAVPQADATTSSNHPTEVE
jgi:hypothetical protein